MKKTTTYTIPAYTLKDLIAGLGVVLESHGDADLSNLTLDVRGPSVHTIGRTSAVDITLKATDDD